MSRNGRTVASLIGVVVLMGAGAWAAVPFYSWFCRTTGYGGTTGVAIVAPESNKVLDQTIRVHFDANVDKNLAWTFRPLQSEMSLRIGETGLAFYEAINNSDVPLTGTASYNVAPEAAGYYFDKIQCFCFTEQTLAPGERMEMPVSFFVDPEITQDVDTDRIRDITLSYTFHLTESAKVQASLDVAETGAIN